MNHRTTEPANAPIGHPAANIAATLAKQCQDATGPDRRLDTLIADLVIGKDRTAIGGDARYTGLIECAMTLMPEGLAVIDLTLSWDTLAERGHPACSVRWYDGDRSPGSWLACTASGKTAALAVANAALQIRSRAKPPDEMPAHG